MAGLAVQNFVSAAAGMAVLVAFIRGLAARSGRELGSFYPDLIRTTLLHPAPAVGDRRPAARFAGRDPDAVRRARAADAGGRSQTLALGPAASQVAIKQLGTNGGGFFNVNSSMPFENPTWFSNFVEMFSILLIPAALTATYGRMVGNRRQGWAIFARCSSSGSPV